MTILEFELKISRCKLFCVCKITYESIEINLKTNNFYRCFKSFKDRHDSRKLTWDQPGWKNVFSDTGAFIKTTKTGILESIQIHGDDDPGIEDDSWLQRSTRPYGGKGYL